MEIEDLENTEVGRREYNYSICIPNKGPYGSNNPRRCIKCNEPMDRGDMGTRKCPKNNKGDPCLENN